MTGPTPARPIKVLELRSVRGTGGGPEKTILLSAARHHPTIAQVTVCYIRDQRDDVFQIDESARQLGIDYVEVRERHSYDWRIIPALSRIVRERGIDIVHAHEYKTDLIALMLARLTGAVPLATAHGWSGDTVNQRLYYAADKFLLRRYPMVVTVSEPMRQELVRKGADPTRVRRVPNGVDTETFVRTPGVRERIRRALGIPVEAIVLGSIGRVESEKRFDLLIGAVAALRDYDDTYVVIAGDGSLRESLRVHARQLGVASRTLLLGHRRDVVDVHQAFDLYVQTSDREGIPNAVLEAMAIETPVVATNVGGTSEIITDGVHGRLTARGDVNALATAIDAALRDPLGSRAMLGAARERVVHEFSFAHRLATIERIYQDLIETRENRTLPLAANE